MLMRFEGKGSLMFGNIANFLLNTIFTLFGAALILRAWLQFVRIPPYDPISNAVLQVTNWIVLPVRRLIPSATSSSIDWTSVIIVFFAAVVYVFLMVFCVGLNPLHLVPMLFVVAILTIVKWILNLVIWLTILMALLSWLNPRSLAMMPILYQLTAPFLNPLRRVIPQLGGIDLAPILLFISSQVLLMIVTRVTASLTLLSI